MKIDYKQIRKDNIVLAKVSLDNFADKVVEGVKSRTPEDTKDLLNSIEKTQQIFTGKFLLQQVKPKTEIPYLAVVEYGVQGNAYNYNKPKGSIFYVGIGAGMFRRTHFDLKDKFILND